MTSVHTSMKVPFPPAVVHSKTWWWWDSRTWKKGRFEFWPKCSTAQGGPRILETLECRTAGWYLPLTIVFWATGKSSPSPPDPLSGTSSPEHSVSHPSDCRQDLGLQDFPAQWLHNPCLSSPHRRKGIRSGRACRVMCLPRTCYGLCHFTWGLFSFQPNYTNN